MTKQNRKSENDSEQDKYNAYILEVLSEKLFESGGELNELLSSKFQINDAYARKILSRAVKSKIIKSSRPYTFGKGQYIYLLPSQELDIASIINICKKHRPPIYRLLSYLNANNGIISYYEAMKITASPDAPSSTKVQTLRDILKLLDKLNIAYEKQDDNKVNYIILKDPATLNVEISEKKLMFHHYTKMVMDCNLIPDIMRWLTKSNIIDNLSIIYRNKKTPAIGAKHNNLLWDAFGYTKTTGINYVHGAKADTIEKQTLAVMDIVLSMPYDELHLDGFYSRIQINRNSVKSGERKVLPIIIYKEASDYILNRISKLGFLAFNIGSIFGTKIYSVLQRLNEINSMLTNGGDIDNTVRTILSTIRAAGQEDALKDIQGVLFEFLIYPLLSSIYSHADMERGKTLVIEENGKKEYYEYDYIIRSSNPRELILVELKGYHSNATIPLGDADKKNSLKWFFRRTVPFAQKYFKKEISDGRQLKAVYMTSAKFWDDGRAFINKLNEGKLKSSNIISVGYERKDLLKLLEEKSFTNEIEIIEKYYSKEVE